MTGRSNHPGTRFAGLFLVLAGSLLWVPAVIATDDKALRLLDEMADATRDLNYDGTFIYQRGPQLDAMRIIHKSEQGRQHERLISLTGYAREVIRNDEAVMCFFPDDETVLVERIRPRKLLLSQISQPVTRLAENYTFNVSGKDRVAGRSTWIVNIIPRDQFRYGYQLWIDENHKLLLKSEVRNDQGEALERIMFTDIDVVDTIPDEHFEPGIPGNSFIWYENPREIRESAVNGHWKVNWLPKGFSMSNHSHQLLPDSESSTHHMVFSDGLAMVSIFVESVKAEKGVIIGPSNVGAVSAFARHIDGYQVVAVGEVPPATVRMMVDSVVQED